MLLIQVTTIVTWEIQQGKEKQFETWRHEIEAPLLNSQDAFRRKPNESQVTNPERYTVIFRFDIMSI